MKTIFKVALPLAAGLFITPAIALSSKATTDGVTSRVVKPMPKEMLKDLTITFDDKGKPIFTLKKELKAIQCDPSSDQGKKEESAKLPTCKPAAKQNKASNNSTSKALTNHANQLTDTVCYTVEWEQDGVIYTYTFCYDTSNTN